MTATDMGSGRHADTGFGKAAYMRNLETLYAHPTVQGFQDFSPTRYYTRNSNCYSLEKGARESGWGTHFYFGGPGRNYPRCMDEKAECAAYKDHCSIASNKFCCRALECDDYKCRIPCQELNEYCSSSDQCCAGVCIGERCTPCRKRLESCA